MRVGEKGYGGVVSSEDGDHQPRTGGGRLTLVRYAGRPDVGGVLRVGIGGRWLENVNQRLPHRVYRVRSDDLIVLLEGMDAAWDQFSRDRFPRSSRSYLHLLRDLRGWCAYNDRFSSEVTLRNPTVARWCSRSSGRAGRRCRWRKPGETSNAGSWPTKPTQLPVQT